MSGSYSNHLISSIALTGDALIDAAVKELHKHGFNDVRRHHFLHISRWMEPTGIRPSELAQRAGVSRQAISDLVTELESLGYVRRQTDPSDSRARLVVYAERGYAADAVLQALWKRMETHLRATYGDQRVNDVTQLLNACMEVIP